jgi:uroporphyrinogen-III decarboxylase
MSYQSGMAAMNMEMSSRVPRTEYSAHRHFELVKRVTGIDCSVEANLPAAAKAFLKAWDYGFMWETSNPYKITVRTDMGHAVYAAGGTDYRPETYCPFKTVEEALAFDPCAALPDEPMEAIVASCKEIYRKKLQRGWDTVVMGGIYHTIFSGLIEIFGWEMLLLAGGTDPDGFARVVDGYFNWIRRYFEAAAKSDERIFMCHDDICWTSGPVFHPDWYRKHIFPKYKQLWRPLLEAGKKVIFTSDGDYTMFFDDIVDCGACSLVMEPSCDMAAFAEKHGKRVGFVGNADTRILLSGTKEDIYREVRRCMDIGKKYPGFILAVGNHIPSNTPVDSALWYNDAYMEMSKR